MYILHPLSAESSKSCISYSLTSIQSHTLITLKMLSRIQSKKALSCAFFKVVEQNNRSGLIDLVLSTHCDPRYVRNEQQQTLLHVACELNCSGAIDMVRVLVEIYQCNPLLTDENAWTAYHCACLSGNVEVLAYLFRKSDHHFISVHQPPPQSFEILFRSDFNLVTIASQSDSIEMLRFAYTIFHHSTTRNGELTLKPSLYKDKLNIICRAMNCQEGTKHTYWWPHKESVLYQACCGGCLDTLKFFLEELNIEEHYYSSPGMIQKSNERAKQGYTLLLDVACRLNNFEIIQYLTTPKGIGPIQTLTPTNIEIINTGIGIRDIKYCQSVCNIPDTCSALHMAARSSNIEYVKGFLAYQHQFHGDTNALLNSACVSGNKDMVKLLMDEYGCTNAGNSDGDTPLHVACEWGYLDICLLLLEQQGCAIDATNARGHTPLSLAVRHSRFEILQVLIQNGANIATKTKDTLETPLHFASCIDFEHQFAIVLLKNSACTLEYLNATDKYGDTALFNACRTKNVDLVKALVLKSENVRLFINETTNEMAAHVACRINSFSVLQVLVSEGLKTPMQCHQLNYLEQSLLHLACENDAEDIVDYLIENKICELNNFDYNGRSPLHIACIRGNTSIVKKLLTSDNFKITDKDEEENTVLHYICNRDVVDPDLIKLICLNVDSMLLEQNSFQYNPLHYLCATDGMQILKCLLEHTRNHNLFNIALCTPNRDGGDTPLHVAFKSRRLMMIRFMFNCSAISGGLSGAICLKNSKMNNVMHCAIEHKRKYFPVYDTDGREIPATFAMMATDLFLQTVNSNNVQEEIIVNCFCQTNHKLYTPIHCLFTDMNGNNNTYDIEFSILSNLADKLSSDAQQRIFSAVTSEGNTVIHLAVERGCSAQVNMLKCVKMIINNQLCDPQKTNNYNQTSLHIVCKASSRSDDSETALFLCEHGCDVHQLDNHGHSPVSYAFENQFSLLKKMITKGYCNPTKAVQSLQDLNSYCHIMGSYETLTIQVPLPHLVVYRQGYESDEIMDFLLSQQEFLSIVIDSFENTIFHLKSFSYKFSDRLIAFCNHDYLNKQNKEKNTPLHLACATGNKQMVKFLIESEKCSESLKKKNNYGYTPLHYAQDRDMINYLILNGADPKDITNSTSVQNIAQTFKMLKDKNPLNPTVTVLVLGNSMAGKTTLIKSLTKAYNWEHIQQPSIGQTKDVEVLKGKSGRTAGIEISEYKVLETDDVRILFYDFAGHPEFESTHSILLQNLLSSSEPHAFLFLLLVDITRHDKLTQLTYWARFIQNCESSFAIGTSEMIVIGSHVDEFSEEEIMHKPIKDSINKTLKSVCLESIENPILLDCRQPKLFELQKVQMLLMRSTKKVKEHANLDFQSHLIFAFLYEHFPNEPVKFSVLQKSFKEKKLTGVEISELSFTRRTIIDSLKDMHYRQHILLIGLQPSSPEADFWILTAKARSLMFKKVNGILFASENNFDRNIKIRSNVGVLPSSVLKEEFPDIEDDLLQQFLEYSELCKKITDTKVLNLLEDKVIEADSEEEMEYEYSSDQMESLNVTQATRGNSNDQPNKYVEYFFFPGLVKGTRDLGIWKSNEGYSYAAGWSLQCTESSFFNALFLQVLLLRLIFQFAVSETKLHRKCIIWKNGVFWSTDEVEMLVEVVNQNQAVNVLVRCFKESELDAVRLRSTVLKEVFKVKEKHCPKTKVLEYITCDPHFNDNGSLSVSVRKVAMTEIISAIIKGSPHAQDTLLQYCVINKSLLCFEPYVGIGDELLTVLFNIDKANETVPEDFVSRIADLQKAASAQVHHADFIMQQVNKPITYQGLRVLFDKYSIFHGRNPKVSVT